MPQPRCRNEVGYGEKMPRGWCTNVACASGDFSRCTICKHQDIRVKNHNKLPRNVRNELDNALVNLCDVWFEHIKPYLVRNNIKLHTSGSSAGGDQKRERPAPPSAPPAPTTLLDDCSHLDPGAAFDCPRRIASCASSLSQPQGASSAPCGRLRTQLRRPLSPLISMPPTPRDGPQIQTHNCQKKLERPCMRRRRRFQAQAQQSWRVPRLCRTLPLLCRGANEPVTKSTSQLPPRDNYYRFIVPRRESVMKNKTTQTVSTLRVSRGCQSGSPGYRCPSSLSPHQRCSKRTPPSCNPVSGSPDHALSPLALPPPITCQLKRSEITGAGIPPLLQDDLIDIIAASNEKRLKLLYSSSERDDHPSFLSLFPNCKPEKTCLKKLPPWR